MRARHAVLPTRSVSSRPTHLRTSSQSAHQSPRIPFFVFKRLRTLSFSVSSKSFACNSYENCRVCTNNSQTGTRPSLARRGGPLISRYFTQVLSFHILTHSFAPLEMPTRLFSSTPALLAQNTGVGVLIATSGGGCGPREVQRRASFASPDLSGRGASQILSRRFLVPGSALRRLCAFQRLAVFPPPRRPPQR